MLKFLLVAVLSVLGPKPDGRTLDEKCPPLTRLTLGLKGRILGSFIERGMTKERVEGILPKDAAFLPTGSVAGGCLWWDVGYTDLKLDIHFFSANGEELRVKSISFRPLVHVPRLLSKDSEMSREESGIGTRAAPTSEPAEAPGRRRPR